MIWPFGHRASTKEAINQQTQVARSSDNVVEATTRMRHDALAENVAAAEGFKDAIERRIDNSTPLREVLRKVIERQRANQLIRILGD